VNGDPPAVDAARAWITCQSANWQNWIATVNLMPSAPSGNPSAFSFDALAQLAGGLFGTVDVPCPECSTWPNRSAAGRRRNVMRVWRNDPAFISFHCNRCGAKGYARDGGAMRCTVINLAQHRRLRAEAERRDAEHHKRQQDKAAWLWRQSVRFKGTTAENYLRNRRRIALDCWPATLRYLPPTKTEHYPAMIAAFGVAHESAYGALAIQKTEVRAVHLTLLKPDGSAKAGTDKDKITIGSALGAPIVLAPLNDLLGLTITEGIEEALTVHQATGLGAWAAGAASRMPALADAVPDYSDFVTIVEDDNEAGRRGSRALAERLRGRGLSAEIINSAR